MADTDLVNPERQDWFVGDINYRTALSEALMRKVGSSINFINDRIIDRYAINFGGYYRVQSISQNSFPSIFIKTTNVVSYYTMKIDHSGSAGDNRINFKVINNLGVELGDFFTTPPRINGTSLTNAMVGYDVKNSNEIRIFITSNYDNGVINPAYTTLLAGYELKPYLVSGSTNALNLSINIGLEAQSWFIHR